MEKLSPSFPEPEPLALMVIEKPVVEKLGPSRLEPESLAIAVLDKSVVERLGVPHDLRAGFGERHHKCLYEAIKLSSSSIQGAQSEGVQEEPGREIPSTPVLSPDIARSDSALAAEGETNPAPGGAYDSNAFVEEVYASRDTPAPTSLSSCSEMKEMLRGIPRALDVDLPPLKMFETAEMIFLPYLLYLPNQCVHHLVDI